MQCLVEPWTNANNASSNSMKKLKEYGITLVEHQGERESKRDATLHSEKNFDCNLKIRLQLLDKLCPKN